MSNAKNSRVTKVRTMDHMRSRKKPVLAKVRIVGDALVGQELAEVQVRIAELEVLLQTHPANSVWGNEVKDLMQRRETLREEVKEELLVFIFKSLGPNKFDSLLEAHPPRDDESAESGKNPEDAMLGFNNETFPDALIVAASYDPKITQEDLDDMREDGNWNQVEILALYGGALSVQNQRRVFELGKD